MYQGIYVAIVIIIHYKKVKQAHVRYNVRYNVRDNVYCNVRYNMYCNVHYNVHFVARCTRTETIFSVLYAHIRF